jgi:ubiquinone/menaquinone biosynthesis C-methylase UbiE
MRDDAAIQRSYYQATAAHYDDSHGLGQIEYAFFVLDGYLGRNKVSSLLDVGSGTGRALIQIQAGHPRINVRGIEPSGAMRSVAYGKGVSPEVLTAGDALALPFADDSIDVVTAFGLLHHVKNPAAAVREMTRVAREAVFLCDTNNWGQGPPLRRAIKSALRVLGLWRLVMAVQTRGTGRKFSPGDGLYYSFSLYDVLPIVHRKFPRIYVMNADAPGVVYNGRLQARGACALAVKG